MGGLAQRFIRWFLTNEARFSIMLACFFLLFLMEPILNSLGAGGFILNVVYTLIMLSALHNCSAESRKIFYLTLVMCMLALLGQWLNMYKPVILISALSFSMAALVIIITVYYLFRHIKSISVVRFDTIAGALCVYLLIGVLGGMSFEFIENCVPGSFHFPQEFISDPQSFSYAGSLKERLIYFSYSTITSLGFGDIVPVSALARSVTMILAICGQVYMTVVMAIIVGTYINSSYRSRHVTKRH